MGTNRWRFHSRKDASACIVVEGEDSARILWGILKDHPLEWSVEELRGTAIAMTPTAPEPEPNSRSKPTPEVPPPPAVSQPERTQPPSLYVTAQANGKRRFVRYALEFRVILVSGGRTFRTHSSDVSIGGMQLKRRIPQCMLEKECRIFVATDKMEENIELTCRIIGDSTNPCRINFAGSDASSLKKLEQWILQANELLARETAA